MKSSRIATALIGSVILAGCASFNTDGSSTAGSNTAASNPTASNPATTPSVSGGSETSGAAFFSTDSIQNISVSFSDADYEAMLQAYVDSGTKEWISADVTINGTTYSQVGLRLKGNSSLRSLTTDEAPETLPWLIRLDKYVADQTHDGRTDFVVRGNNSESSLNEALALQVLAQAGVPAQDFAFTRFSVNGSANKLRLVVDLPDDEAWAQSALGATGSVYKADSGGDYSYRGDDPESYLDVFDQKTGEADLTPVIEFLDFINNSTDDEFASQLDDYLDVSAFATYLAGQELIHNSDDIDGPGNNSYLFYDEATEQFTVVAWDHNLAYGQSPGGMGGGPGGAGGPGNGQRSDRTETEDRQPPEDFQPPTGISQTPGRGGGSNPLVTRFLANDEFNALYEEQLAALQTDIVDSGLAQSWLDTFSQLLTTKAADLIDPQTVSAEAEQIATRF